MTKNTNNTLLRFHNDEVKRLEKRLSEAENLLHDIKLTGSHYQIKEKVDRFFEDDTYTKTN